MTDPIDPSRLDDPRDAAAYWFARLQSGEAGEAERAACETWRRADPAHERQYRRVAQLWDAAAGIPAEQLRRLGHGRTGRPARADRRRFAWGLSVACGAAAVLAAVDPAGWLRPPDYEADFATAIGERREFALPDGSTLLLNTATEARVRFYPDRRSVALLRGEALFSVRRTLSSPFVVDMPAGSVRVTGTQFNIRTDDRRFSVTVTEGSVEVESGGWWRRRSARLSAGTGATAWRDGELRTDPAADVATATAWREGKIVFRATPLAQAVEEINRYLPDPVLLAGAGGERLRVSGIFDAADPAALLQALPRIVPVDVRTRGDGRTEIVPR